MRNYTYEIDPRPAELGGGWRLRLLIDGQQGKPDPVVLPWPPEFDTGPRAMRSDGEPLTGVPEVDLDDPTAPEDLGNAR
ncbi:hypothetical protein [Xanthomonas hortorum]|uniref:Uncharacterized protein n=1 Tax=Xanthomonas hortorum TaxID=56454 RepID=A0AA47EX80_9XANT|nr:hypothetical protein [Xanthomonas hortorum]WAH66891.1 hypothetical protein OEG85_24305 [Xanthomonas hortorum]